MDKRIGAQLYTVRDYVKTKEDFDLSLKKLSDIGYKAVQLSGIGEIEAEDIREICDKYKITAVCTHRSMDEYLNNLEWSIDFHKKTGCTIAGLGAMPGIWGDFTEENVVEFVKDMNRISAEFKKNGISFAYHNHAVEFIKLANGQYLMDYFIENGEFDFIVDVYWLAFAGINPAEFIRKLGKRAIVIHFKDLKIERGNKQQMAEVMVGNLDWDEIIKASEEAGALWAMVEQDTCEGNPFDSLKISYDNLKTKGFN